MVTVVEQIMSHHVATVREDLPAWQAARMLKEKKIHSLVVVNDEGGVAGIITASDFLAVAEQLLRARTRTK